MMGVHDGHRERLKKRFIKYGLDNFDDHTALELMLFYAMPRGDVNPIAHALLERFGTVAGVFDAPVEELCRVKGIGENAATLIKLIPQLGKRYQISKESMDNIIYSTERAGEFLIPHFYSETNEVVYMLSLDAKYKLINCSFLGRGSVNSAEVSVRKVVETALLYNATNVILAHNHTSGIAVPSKEDEIVTKRIAAALAAVDISLTDHLVIADRDFVSMADNGLFQKVNA